jgi:hypothetical protein
MMRNTGTAKVVSVSWLGPKYPVTSGRYRQSEIFGVIPFGDVGQKAEIKVREDIKEFMLKRGINGYAIEITRVGNTMENKVIKLNEDESMLLLIAKGHERKDVPGNEEELGTMEYINKCLKYRCYDDADSEYAVSFITIYSSLAEKLLTAGDLLRVMSKTKDPMFPVDVAAGLIGALRMVQVYDTDYDTYLVELDWSLMVGDG